MELEHSFIVPVPRERAWDVLLDVERVASCMPGATLDSVDGDEIHGRIKVKVGPINMAYAGTARFTERDADAGTVTLEASGKETRGAGTAAASVRSVLEDRGDETQVTVHTSLNVTGKPAQFGRGVMAEVSGKLLSIFAANLATTLSEPDTPAAAAGGTGAAGDGPAGDGPAASDGPAAARGTGGDTPSSGVAASGSGKAEPEPGDNGQRPARSGSDAAAQLSDLGLPARAVASLNRDGVATIGQLTARTEDQLLAIDGIGPASVEEIKAKLAERHLALTAPAAGTVTATDSGATADGAPVGAAPAATAGTAGTAGTAKSTGPAAVPSASAREAAHQFEDDAINLLKVAGMPVLKRAIPVLAGLAAAGLIGFRKRMHRRRHSADRG